MHTFSNHSFATKEIILGASLRKGFKSSWYSGLHGHVFVSWLSTLSKCRLSLKKKCLGSFDVRKLFNYRCKCRSTLEYCFNHDPFPLVSTQICVGYQYKFFPAEPLLSFRWINGFLTDVKYASYNICIFMFIPDMFRSIFMTNT